MRGHNCICPEMNFAKKASSSNFRSFVGRESICIHITSATAKAFLELSVLSEQSIFKRDRYCYCSVLSKSALHYLSSRSPWLLCDMCSASVSICQTLPRIKKERDWRRAECANIHSKARERAGEEDKTS